MRTALIIGAASLAYATVLVIFSFRYSFEARIFPLVVGTAGMLVAALYTAAEWRDRRTARVGGAAGVDVPVEGSSAPVDRRHLWLFIVLVVGSTLVLYLLGVYVYAVVFPIVFARVFSGYSWRVAVPLGLSLGAFIYLMFDRILDAPLDRVGLLLQ